MFKKPLSKRNREMSKYYWRFSDVIFAGMCEIDSYARRLKRDDIETESINIEKTLREAARLGKRSPSNSVKLKMLCLKECYAYDTLDETEYRLSHNLMCSKYKKNYTTDTNFSLSEKQIRFLGKLKVNKSKSLIPMDFSLSFIPSLMSEMIVVTSDSNGDREFQRDVLFYY